MSTLKLFKKLFTYVVEYDNTTQISDIKAKDKKEAIELLNFKYNNPTIKELNESDDDFYSFVKLYENHIEEFYFSDEFERNSSFVEGKCDAYDSVTNLIKSFGY